MSITKATEHFYVASSTIPTDTNVYSLLANGDLMKAFEDADEAQRDYEQSGPDSKEAIAAKITCAEVCLASDEVDQANQMAEEALKSARRGQHTKLEAAAMNVIAKAFSFWQSPEDAKVKAKDAMDVAKASGDANIRACIHHTLAQALQQGGHGPQAIVVANDMASLFAKSDPIGEGCSLICVAELQTANGDYRAALSTAKDAADALSKAGDVGKQALALSTAASAALATANSIPEGFDLADKAQSLFDSCGDKRSPIPLKINMANAKFDSEAYVEAEDLAEEAQTAAKKISDIAYEAKAAHLLATIRLAIAAEDAKDKDEADTVSATEAARDALFLFRKVGDRRGEAGAMLKLAEVRYQSKAYDMAKMAAEEAQSMYKELGDVSREARAVLLIAHVMHADQLLDGARRSAQKAFTLYQSAGDNEGMEECTTFLDKVKVSQAEKTRTEKKEKKTVSDTGLVKLVNSVDESSHLLSYFADLNEEEDTELGEFDLKEWGSAMNMLKIQS